MKMERIVRWIRWPMLLVGLVAVPTLAFGWMSATAWDPSIPDPLTAGLWRLAAVLGALTILLGADVLRRQRGSGALMLLRYTVVGGTLGLCWPIWGLIGIAIFEMARVVPWIMAG